MQRSPDIACSTGNSHMAAPRRFGRNRHTPTIIASVSRRFLAIPYRCKQSQASGISLPSLRVRSGYGSCSKSRLERAAGIGQDSPFSWTSFQTSETVFLELPTLEATIVLLISGFVDLSRMISR